MSIEQDLQVLANIEHAVSANEAAALRRIGGMIRQLEQHGREPVGYVYSDLSSGDCVKSASLPRDIPNGMALYLAPPAPAAPDGLKEKLQGIIELIASAQRHSSIVSGAAYLSADSASPEQAKRVYSHACKTMQRISAALYDAVNLHDSIKN